MFGNWPSMRRVVSHTSPAEKMTWFSCTPTPISSTSPAMRASSCSARLGMIASSSAAGEPSDVSLTASRYESVAAITSLSPANWTRTPVSTGRASSREAARATRSIVSSSGSRSTANVAVSVSSGSRGKSSALNVCSV